MPPSAMLRPPFLPAPPSAPSGEHKSVCTQLLCKGKIVHQQKWMIIGNIDNGSKGLSPRAIAAKRALVLLGLKIFLVKKMCVIRFSLGPQ